MMSHTVLVNFYAAYCSTIMLLPVKYDNTSLPIISSYCVPNHGVLTVTVTYSSFTTSANTMPFMLTFRTQSS